MSPWASAVAQSGTENAIAPPGASSDSCPLMNDTGSGTCSRTPWWTIRSNGSSNNSGANGSAHHFERQLVVGRGAGLDPDDRRAAGVERAKHGTAARSDLEDRQPVEAVTTGGPLEEAQKVGQAALTDTRAPTAACRSASPRGRPARAPPRRRGRASGPGTRSASTPTAKGSRSGSDPFEGSARGPTWKGSSPSSQSVSSDTTPLASQRAARELGCLREVGIGDQRLREAPHDHALAVGEVRFDRLAEQMAPHQHVGLVVAHHRP